MIGITVANNKGGVGKTTLSVSIASCLAHKGYNVLLVDNDPQANATCYLNREGITPSIYDIFAFDMPIEDIIVHTDVENLDLLPSHDKYSKAVKFIESETAFEKLFIKRFHPFVDKYDFVIIDCPPQDWTLIKMALGFSQYILMPIIPDEFSRQASEKMSEIINEIKEDINSGLKILGMVPNLKEYTNRYKDENFDTDMVMETKISKLEDFKHSQDEHKPINVYAPHSKATKQIEALTDECLSIIERG